MMFFIISSVAQMSLVCFHSIAMFNTISYHITDYLYIRPVCAMWCDYIESILM